MFWYATSNNVIKNYNTMPCGCKNKQNQAAPKNEGIKKAKPLSNGVRGLRTEKRIIR